MNTLPDKLVKQAPKSEGYAVLLLEDNAGDAIIVEEYLREYIQNLELVHAETFKEASSKIDSRPLPFDAVLLDLTVPDKAGMDLVKSMAAKVGQTPIIVLTGYSDEMFSVKSLEMGVADYLLKGEFNAFALYKSLLYGVEKNKMNRRLNAANKTLVAALDIARLGRWYFDVQKNAFECSEEMWAMLGLPGKCGYLTRSAYSEMILPADLHLFELGFSEMMRTENGCEIEHRISTLDNEQKHVFLRGEATKNEKGEVIGMDGVIQDITTRKKHEVQRNLLESVITHANDTVIITKGENTDKPGPEIVYVNQAFTNLTGYEASEAIGKSPRFLQGPDTSREELDKLKHAMIEREACQIEVVNYSKFGEPYWIEMSVVPILDADGSCTHFISIQRDVTERKKHEQTLIDLTENLEHQVASRTQELQSAHELLHYHYSELKDSLVYAQSVQRAILGTEVHLNQLFKESFLMAESRDLVSGDFLWCHEVGKNLRMVAVADCTGHGVPGALLSMIAHQLLNQSIRVKRLTNPAKILQNVHVELLKIYKPNHQVARQYNGMDVGLLVVDEPNETIHYCGARQNLYCAYKGKITRIKGNKFTIGEMSANQVDSKLETITRKYKPGEKFYLSSDGILDQFGGNQGKKLMNKGLVSMLEKFERLPMGEQGVAIRKAYLDWKGDQDQTDDVLVMGISP